MGDQLFYFDKWFPKLTDLKMRSVIVHEIANSITIPYLERLSIWIGALAMTNETAKRFLRANSQLKSLTFTYREHLLTLDKFFNMLSGNPFLSKLIVSGSDDLMNLVEVNPFIGKHPVLIKELNLELYRLTADVAVIIMQKLKSLESFDFRIKNYSECDLF